MREKLRDAAEVAYRMGDIPKPDLVDLMKKVLEYVEYT